MKFCSTLAVVMLTATFPISAESLPELLRPVDPAIAAKLQSPTNYEFRLQRQAAKRYRIVEINLELLNQEGAQFTITPFDDLAIAVKTQTPSREPKQDRMREWVGVPDSAENLTIGSHGEPALIPPQIIALWVTEGPRDVPLEVARKVAIEERDTSRLQMLPKSSGEPGAPRITTRLDVVTVAGQWIARPGVEVVLQPIDDDPRYHFVFEVDQDKMPNSVHASSANERKLRAQKEYYDQVERERAAAATTKP
jgi:hypothetical protein